MEVPKDILIDQFIYEEYQKDDTWGDETFGEPTTIENVRIDHSVQLSRDATQTKILAEAVIFCYASATSPFLAFKERSKITFEGREYVLKKVVTVKEPYQDKVWAYELEVL